jgi:hypothetical protein
MASSFLTSLTSALGSLATPANLSAVTQLVSSTFGNHAWNTVQPMFAQLQVVAGTPAAAKICDQIASTPGVPSAAVILLEKIPTITDPLMFQQYIATAETIIQGAPAISNVAQNRLNLTL